MIKQARVSHGLRRFKQGLLNRWNLADYHDKNESCLFLNINDQGDINAVNNHKGFKLVFFANARANQFVNKLNNDNIVLMSFNPYLTVPQGMKHKSGLFELKDFSMFEPNKLGDCVYCYVGNQKQKHKYDYGHALKLQKQIGYKILFGFQVHTIQELKRDYYDRCFVNLNLNKSGGGGLLTMFELAMMGRKTIMNTRHDYDCIVPYRNDMEIIEIIVREAQNTGRTQLGRDYHTIGPEWQSETFWTSRTFKIDELLCHRAKFLTDEGWGGKPMHRFPFYTACVMYLNGYEQEGKKLYYDLIKYLFEKYGTTHMRDGGIKGFWWYENIMKFSTLKDGMKWWVENRFKLLESIKEEYHPYLEPITVRKHDDKYYLSDGHHRLCILYALGYKNIENVKIK